MKASLSLIILAFALVVTVSAGHRPYSAIELGGTPFDIGPPYDKRAAVMGPRGVKDLFRRKNEKPLKL